MLNEIKAHCEFEFIKASLACLVMNTTSLLYLSMEA